MLRESLMGRARDLAERGRYTVAPNPLVGAVIVHDGELIGEGWHRHAGGDHAEVDALKSCGDAAQGATIYVSLEPCNHHGRTPPCTEAIVSAGIERVVIGQLDPYPKMRGKSVEILRESGVEVEVLDDFTIEHQNEQYFQAWRVGRPFVHLKLATTLDGEIATHTGDSKWVTGEEARLRAHLLRAEAGAVLVGANTAIADDPMLNARGLSENPPTITRAVLDPHLKLGVESRLVKTAEEAPVLIFVNEDSLDRREREFESFGAEVIPTPKSANGMDLYFVLEELDRRGVRGVLVEGGGDTAGRFVRERLVDKMTLFYAPRIVGADGISMVGPLGLDRMSDAFRFFVENVEIVGEDVAMTLYPREEDHVHRPD